MVEYAMNLDSVFHSLADATRRDILRRVCVRELSISELAEDYKMSFAAVAKHLSVLEKAKLIVKRKVGKQQIVAIEPAAFQFASEHLEQYQKLWAERYDRLEKFLNEEES